MFGRCPKQQSGYLLDADRFNAGNRRGNYSCVSITGGGALDVDARILSIFDVKKAANSSAEKGLEI